MPDWSDKRPIEDLRFGTEWKPTLGDLQAQQPGFGEVGAKFPLRAGDPPGEEVLAAWKETHATALSGMRAILDACGCKIAEDIVALGCTGLVHKITTCPPFELWTRLGSINTARFFRLGIGGSGVGLPCYVPPDRYCLVHEVSGGLQDGQEPHHLEAVESISRSLTAQEATQSALVSHAKGSTEAVASDLLAGRKLPEGWEHERQLSPESRDLLEAGLADARAGRVSPVSASVLQSWECPEHKETMWACRYCVAQAIVEGDLQLTFAVRPAVGGFTKAGVSAREATEEVAYLDSANASRVDVYVLAATFIRKLAR